MVDFFDLDPGKFNRVQFEAVKSFPIRHQAGDEFQILQQVGENFCPLTDNPTNSVGFKDHPIRFLFLPQSVLPHLLPSPTVPMSADKSDILSEEWFCCPEAGSFSRQYRFCSCREVFR